MPQNDLSRHRNESPTPLAQMRFLFYHHKKKDKNVSIFTISDIEQIQSHGLNPAETEKQIATFKSGFPCTNIISPATIGNGVLPMLDETYAEYYLTNCDKYKIVKFVPASGAATRMFKDLFEYLSTDTMNTTTQTVLDNLTDFAFYDDLKQHLPGNATNREIIEYLVTNRGLNYGNAPKGLIQFHKYNTFNRTAAAEHLIEGTQYARTNNTVNLHFTVSPEHISGFQNLFNKIVPKYEAQFGVKYNISISTQKPETDTISVNLDNTPFRNDDGT